MAESEEPVVGMAYISQRTGQTLTVLKLEDDRVYYAVGDFDTISPLFLPKEKFMHLVGLNTATS